jgi:hypothetical protein
MTRLALFYRLSIALAVITISAAGCGAESLLGPLVTLTNGWRNEANPDHRFIIQDQNAGGNPQREGTFDGTEQLPDGDTFFDLEGFWTSDGKIQFTVHRASDVTYRGTLTDNPKRIAFTSSAGPLVLITD